MKREKKLVKKSLLCIFKKGVKTMRYWYKAFEFLKLKHSYIFYKTPTNITYW